MHLKCNVTSEQIFQLFGPRCVSSSRRTFPESKLFRVQKNVFLPLIWRQNDDDDQCDQIGRFLKVLGLHGFYQKLPKYMVNFWAKVKSNIFHVKVLWLLFGQILE